LIPYGSFPAGRKRETGWRATRLPDGQITSEITEEACPALPQKIFRFTRRANQWFVSARLTQEEGRLAIVTNVRWDAVDAKSHD
jgi:hypothetical protein